ncbi:Pentatricopeptide repeat-containing protein [Actinidia chinensis var. chinensis]|uniref:Pentatricopeptide repeat-containing protein n=1 Tax=Actinidia chinensis var. chinensis TaxID=1590841 RepID=A0A2R6PKB2_ACTCC|nr:Pentatricopeptide repeat-containing protein [Actinidia chinensis var. chinensis]
MNHTLSHLLQGCQSLRSLKSIHARLMIDGSIASSDLILNKILRLYSRFGATDYAHKLFDEIPQPNSFLWTSMIHGYVENCEYTQGLATFSWMRSESVDPLNFTICSVLKALARLTRLKDGVVLYGFVLKSGFGCDLIVQNAMIDLFMRCGKVDFARWVFNEMHEKDVISWNSMISGYGNNGRVEAARELFNIMVERSVISWTSMICGYVKAGDMLEAQALFEAMPVKDLASWNVMISGYVEAGDLNAARFAFERTRVRDVGTWNLMISGFCKAGEVESAKDYFNRMPSKNVASWTIMIDGYIKAGEIDNARCLFDQMPERNLVAWSTIIGGCAKNGQPRCALELFDRFKEQGIKTDETFILGIILACSQLGILDAAESIIRDYVGPSLSSNLRVVTSLIDMYAKCGSIKKAFQVFEMVHHKDLLCYSTMIAAFANHGLSQEAISLFNEMYRENVRPDGVTFLGVLVACSHGGLVNEGKWYFKQMTEEFGIWPSEKHYACMVGLLGRSGCLEEAHDLIRSIPVEVTSVVWGALLAACTVHCNIQLAETAAAELFMIEPDNSGNYILLSNIYAAAGRWRDVAKMRAVIREKRVRKNRGSSWIELDSVIHEFVTGDVSHSESDNVYLMLDLLREDMKHTRCVIDANIKS